METINVHNARSLALTQISSLKTIRCSPTGLRAFQIAPERRLTARPWESR
jgi:hypothetical protein